MEQFAIIKDIVIILLVSIPIIFIFRKLNIPSIVGFLIAGMIIGPFGFQLITEVKQIEVMAEIGVILLLFTIGLEVSIGNLMKMKRLMLYAGGLQILLTTAAAAIIFSMLGIPVSRSIYLGMLISLSSTAIVLKLLADRNELEAPYGRLGMGILIFQDLAIVPMFLLLPILGAGPDVTLSEILLQLLFAFGAVAVIITLARFLMPKILYQLAKLRIREAFTVGIILLLLGTAYLTHSIGLSFALGAFIAGLIVSESEFSHQVVAEILPLKDVFNSIFFISVGLLLNFHFVILHPAMLTLITVLLIAIKALIIAAIVVFMKYPLRVAVLTGLGLAQVGEFSFILAQAGTKFGLLNFEMFNAFLASSIFTMVLTPFLMQFTPAILNKFALSEPAKSNAVPGKEKEIEDHVIIVGFGMNGKNVARVLKETGIQYIVIELNPDTVRRELAKGEKIIYGDITKDEILHHTNIQRANVIVFAISDPQSTRIGLQLAKRLNPSVHAIVRTRYTSEIEDLMTIGADVVIPEEFETSLQIFSKVLEKYHIPLNVIMKQISILRGESYSLMVKDAPDIQQSFIHLNEILAAGLTETYYVNSDNVHTDKSLSELDLRAKTDATIIAMVRNGATISNPSGKEKIQSGDTLVITGTHNAVDKAFDYLDGK